MITSASTSRQDYARQLRRVLNPPDAVTSQQHAQKVVSSALPTPLAPSRLAHALKPLLASEEAKAAQLAQQLAASTHETTALLSSTKGHLETLLTRTIDLKNTHESMEDALIDHTEILVSSASQREQLDGAAAASAEASALTLREQLETFSHRRKELELAKQWFKALVTAEELGIASLKAMDEGYLSEAIKIYVDLVNYVKETHTGAPNLALTSHLVAMASSVWNGLVKSLSGRLLQRLETIGWPKPIAKPLSDLDSTTSDFQQAFVDMLTLEKIGMAHPLPNAALMAAKDTDSPMPSKPLIAFQPFVHPLLLRFRWHFDGDRNTNRIDKPEYPLSHVLNLLSAHERFLSEEVQVLLEENGFHEVNAVNEFTTLLLPPLAARIKHHMPQLLEMPPILAHTVFQVLEFDEVLRGRDYRPRGLKSDWKGLSEIILGKKEWYGRWLDGEREFFDKKYYAAISDKDAWQILSEDDYDADDGRSGTRPTNSALRVAELSQLLSDRYRPLPIKYGLPFLLRLHLPLLVSYAQRITSSLDAFDSLSFGRLPGALATTSAATSGVGGLLRVVRAGVSARWMSEKCSEWGEDAFFLTLYDHLTSTPPPEELVPLASAVLTESDGTLFDRERKEFEKLADRSEELIVKHCVREVLHELKAYLGKRWDFTPPDYNADQDDPTTSSSSPLAIDYTLSPELTPPLSLFTSLLTTLVQSYPHAVATTLYRRIAVQLSHALYDRLLINRSWSEHGAHQLNFDLEHGFLQAGREAGIRRGVGRGWDKLVGGGIVMALPAADSVLSKRRSRRGERHVQQHGENQDVHSAAAADDDDADEDEGEDEDEDEDRFTFAKVMQLAFDDAVPEGEGTQFNVAMEKLGVGEVLGKVEVQQVMRRRPECWR